jgi:hypothetical protein
MCGSDAGWLAINYQSLSNPPQACDDIDLLFDEAAMVTHPPLSLSLSLYPLSL